MTSNFFLADNNGAPWAVNGDRLRHRHRHRPGPQLGADTTDARWGLSMATSGDLLLATSGDFSMAMDIRSKTSVTLSGRYHRLLEHRLFAMGRCADLQASHPRQAPPPRRVMLEQRSAQTTRSGARAAAATRSSNDVRSRAASTAAVTVRAAIHRDRTFPLSSRRSFPSVTGNTDWVNACSTIHCLRRCTVRLSSIRPSGRNERDRSHALPERVGERHRHQDVSTVSAVAP